MADGHGHIQKHLHSMFKLLRPEETLKMAVKLESARYGRTRYLVVASCTRQPTQRELSSQQHLNLMNAQNINNNNNPNLNQNNSSSSSSISSNNAINNNNNNNNININSNNSSNNRKSIGLAQQQQQQQQQPNAVTTVMTTVAPVVSVPTTISTNNNSGGGSQLSSSTSPTFVKSATKILINGKDVIGDGSGARATLAIASSQHRKQIDNKNEIEEACLLGIDCNEKTTVGLVLRILGDTTIRLDGDGGFCISGSNRTHIFKPVSVQAMWSALQTLHKVCDKAQKNNFFPGGPSHDWVTFYDQRIESDRSCLNEWNAMDSIESRRPPSPGAIRNKPTEREETEQMIKAALKEIIVQLDLDEVTSKYIRTRLEERMDMNLTEYKSFIDEEMLIILGQMDAPTKIFDHVYLGSEWNASNLEELQRNGVRHILNVTREIDNFFPGMFEYYNVRVYDDEKTNLLKHWDKTFKYISQAKKEGSKVLVHCKMGVSRSASVVIAYAMKAYDWSFSEALDHVKLNRNCIKPNKNFLTQLETYQGILLAMKNREKLQRSKSDTNLRSTKDARLLPGSEPTPLIQAFNAAAKKTLATPFHQRTVNCLPRAKSWSPDSVESSVLLPKQLSLSLENLPPDDLRDDLKTKNVRVPNGRLRNCQNYSVSQNHVFQLDEYLSSVKSIVSELESHHQKRRSESIRSVNSNNSSDWDPGDKISPDVIRRNSAKQVIKSTTSSTCDKSPTTPLAGQKPVSPFSSMRRSESDRTPSSSSASSSLSTTTTTAATKSSSTEMEKAVTKSKSLDTQPTAVAVNKVIVSPTLRHSTSDDTRPTLQSSGNAPFPGWSRRCASFNAPNSTSSTSSTTSTSSSSSSNASLSGMASDLNNQLYKSGAETVKNLRNTYTLRDKNAANLLIQSTVNKPGELVPLSTMAKVEKRTNDSDSSDTNIANMNSIVRFADQFSKDFMQCIKKRCKSDEALYESDILSTVNKRLSASSPAEYSNTDKSFLGRSTLNWANRVSTPKFISAHHHKTRRVKNSSLRRTVENLKLNFESREADGGGGGGVVGVVNDKGGFAKEPKRGKSLPSSPVASVYINNTAPNDTTSKLNYDKLGCEEISVKGLVDRYEVTKLKGAVVDAANAFTATANNINTTTSPIFTNLNAHLKRAQHRLTATVSEKAATFNSNNIIHPKPPPVPHSPIVVKPPANILLTTKRMQQENNSPSFATIRQHFNSASAYNTM